MFFFLLCSCLLEQLHVLQLVLERGIARLEVAMLQLEEKDKLCIHTSIIQNQGMHTMYSRTLCANKRASARSAGDGMYTGSSLTVTQCKGLATTR